MATDLERRFGRLALAFAVLGAGIGAIGVIAHALGWSVLAATRGAPLLQPLSGVAFAVAGVAIAARSAPRAGALGRRVSKLCGLAVLTVALLVLAEYAFGVDLTIDRLVPHRMDAGPFPGRPSPLTALALVPLALSVLLFDVVLPRGVRPREWLSLVALGFAFVSLVGLLYGTGALYDLEGADVRGVSIASALALASIAIATLLARPEEGFMRIVVSPGPGGVVLRGLGAAAILGVPVLGLVLLVVVGVLGVEDLPLMLAIGSVSGVSVVLVVLLFTAIPLEHASEAERAARRRLGELVELAPLGIFVADLEGRLREVNAAGCRLLGMTREEVIDKAILELIPPEDTERLAQLRDRLLAGATETADFRLRRGDGSYVHAEVTTTILPDGRWQGFARDVTDRVALERDLVESRDWLRRVLESSTEYAIVAEDLEGRVVLWNEGARRTYGYSDEEILGRSSGPLVPVEDRMAWERLHANALAHGTAEATITAERRDGARFAAKVVCTRRVDANGTPAGVLLVARDLTLEQLHLAEQEFLARAGVELAAALEERETLQITARLAVERLGDIASIDVFDVAGRRRAALAHRDPSFEERMYAMAARLPALERRGRPFADVLDSRTPRVVEETGEALVDVLATGPEHRAFLRSLGVQSMMLVPLVARGQLLALMSVLSSDPARLYGPEDLRVAEELARRAALALDNVRLYHQSRLQGAIVTNLAEGVILIRASDGRIVYANPRFEQMFRYGPGELVGTPIAALNAPGDLSPERRAEQIQRCIRETGGWHGELETLRKDGTRFWCSASVSVFDHSEHGTVWIAIHADIEKRKQLEERSARALREKEVLLKEIHHRVKNNLQVISSLFALQSSRTESPELRSLLDESRVRVQSIALVHEHIYGSADLAVIDFDGYLRGLVATLRAAYGAEGVEIEASARDVLLDVEEAVPCALVVCELVSNSLKHAFPSRVGTVSVRARLEPDGRCLLTIADDGVGIPEGFDWMTAPSLGLRLVRGLTRQLRGTVELDRSRGTRFTIRFPLRHAAEDASSVGASPP